MRIGVDLGGTKIEAVALSAGGELLARRRVPTPRGDYDATIAALHDLVAELERVVGCQGSVGVGMPGVISSTTGVVKNANSTWLNGRALADDLQRVLERPIRFANDANCFALSEATDGAARGAAIVFGVILGTGTGGGVVVNGQVLAGENGIAGEWGHNALPWPSEDEWPGPSCYCGRRGCIETFLSGPGMARDYRQHHGVSLSPEEIVMRARDGDRSATAAMDRYVGRAARALASVINLLDPEVIVLGGGLSNIDEFYDAIVRQWGAFVFSDTVTTRLVKALHGDSSGVRGAAWLWPNA